MKLFFTVLLFILSAACRSQVREYHGPDDDRASYFFKSVGLVSPQADSMAFRFYKPGVMYPCMSFRTFINLKGSEVFTYKSYVYTEPFSLTISPCKKCKVRDSTDEWGIVVYPLNQDEDANSNTYIGFQ